MPIYEFKCPICGNISEYRWTHLYDETNPAHCRQCYDNGKLVNVDILPTTFSFRMT